MTRLRPRTWAKLTLGVLLIGGTLAILWAVYQPGVREVAEPQPTSTPSTLEASRAVVTLRRQGAARVDRASITCDGARRAATGFWASRSVAACDALASTRGALVAGPGCQASGSPTAVLHVTGSVEGQRFDHRAERGGCSSDDEWLAVNVLVSPVLVPDRAAQDPGQ